MHPNLNKLSTWIIGNSIIAGGIYFALTSKYLFAEYIVVAFITILLFFTGITQFADFKKFIYLSDKLNNLPTMGRLALDITFNFLISFAFLKYEWWYCAIATILITIFATITVFRLKNLTV
jgi:hypothetical protein